MTCVAGRIADLDASFDAGSNWATLAALIDASIEITVDELECTSHDSTTREFIPNFLEATLSANFHWSETDASQISLVDTLFPTPTSFKVRFSLEQDVGVSQQYEADAFLTSATISGPRDDTAQLDTSMRLSNVVAQTYVAP